MAHQRSTAAVTELQRDPSQAGSGRSPEQPLATPTRERPSNQVSNNHHPQQWTPADTDGPYFPDQACRGAGSQHRDLRAIYTAADKPAAAAALEAFAATWENRYPAIIKLWRAHWAEFIPFLAFPPEVRRVIYTTNLIESMNARLRKVTRYRGQFPSEQAALKVLYLAVRNLEEFCSPNIGSAVPDGNRRFRHLRSTSKDESQPHDRHGHLHRRPDAPLHELPLYGVLRPDDRRIAGAAVGIAPYGRVISCRASVSWLR